MIFKSQKGFSMVEMLCAIVILMVGLLGLAQLQITAIKANSHSHTITTATMVGQMVYESIRATSQSHEMFYTDATGLPGSTIPGVPDVVTNQAGGDYRVIIDVDYEPHGITHFADIYIHIESVVPLMNVNGNKVRRQTIKCNKRLI